MAEPSTRRDFVRAVALAAPGSTVAVAALGDDAKGPEPPPSEVDARMALILARFGPKLDAEARKAIRSEVEAIVGRVVELRKIPLTNGDGPFPVFTPYRAPLA